MLLGQLPELKHNHNNTPLKSLQHYLDIRFNPLGVYPLLTFIEHHCLPDTNIEYSHPSIQRLKHQITTLAIIQNDLGGLEKDLTKNNRSNVVFALAELEGTRMQAAEDVVQQRHIIERAVEEHDALVDKVIDSWRDVKGNGDRRMGLLADMMFTLSVTHLQWTLNTARYITPETEGKVEKRY